MKILSGEFTAGDRVVIEAGEDGLTFSKAESAVGANALA